MMLTIADRDLAALVRCAEVAVAADAQAHQTQRGATHSLNRVALTWQAPQTWGEGLRWSHADIAWYLATFVAADAAAADSGALLFPYTYASRSRRWDGGWGALAALLDLLPQMSVTLAHAHRTRATFMDLLAALGDEMHLQTVLSLLALYPYAQMQAFAATVEQVRAIALAWRRDLVAGALTDIAINSHSRRAVVGPLGYPQLEAQLQPQMGKPPYQLFQFLPDDAAAPISSIHEHRSLDVTGGAPLDFAHDHAWLREPRRSWAAPSVTSRSWRTICTPIPTRQRARRSANGYAA